MENQDLTNKYVIITNGNQIKESHCDMKTMIRKAQKYIKKGTYTEIWYYTNDKRTLLYYWN